jgi:hypothetical protein
MSLSTILLPPLYFTVYSVMPVTDNSLHAEHSFSFPLALPLITLCASTFHLYSCFFLFERDKANCSSSYIQQYKYSSSYIQQYISCLHDHTAIPALHGGAPVSTPGKFTWNFLCQSGNKLSGTECSETSKPLFVYSLCLAVTNVI